MKKAKLPLLGLSTLCILACEQVTTKSPENSSSQVDFNCQTESLTNNAGIKIICNGDSIGYVLNGVNGKDGVDGTNGVNGIDGKDGKDGLNGADGKDGKGESCAAIPFDDLSGFKIMCGQDSVGVLLNGKDGADGKDGLNGVDGKDGVDGLSGVDGKDGKDGVDGIDGNDGVNGKDGKDGIDGKDGVDGADGKDGEDGASCTIAPLADGTGYKVLCGGDSTGVLLNGINGKDGKDGLDGADGKDGVDGKDGKDGIDGKDGEDGKDGADGYSPEVTTRILSATEEHPNGGAEVTVTYKDAEGVIQTTRYTIWNGTNGTDGKDGTNGKDGIDGTNGTDGTNGVDGYSPTINVTNVDATPEHPNGGLQIIITYKDGEGNVKSETSYVWNGANGADGQDGKDGTDGTNGTDGSNGADGYSPTMIITNVDATPEHPNGGLQIIITYKDGEGNVKSETSYVWNGANGADGKDGKDGQDYTPSSSSVSSSSAESSSSVASSSSEASSSSIASSSSEAELSQACKDMRATKDSFIPLENVFDCVRSNEKVVFVIRHAERWKDASGSTGDLNEFGQSQATYLGEKLASQQEFHYMSTYVFRTMRTNILISQGKGETFLNWDNVYGKNAPNYIISDDFTEAWYQASSYNKDVKCDGVGSWAQYTKMAYEPNVCPSQFLDVDVRTKDIVDKHFMYNNVEKVTMVISHDQFLAPFLISVTDRKIGMDAYNYVYPNGQYNDWNQNVFKHWPNYLSGAAIIINENNERTFVPVRGLKTGYLGYHCPNNDNEDNLYTCRKWEKNVN